MQPLPSVMLRTIGEHCIAECRNMMFACLATSAFHAAETEYASCLAMNFIWCQEVSLPPSSLLPRPLFLCILEEMEGLTPAGRSPNFKGKGDIHL